MVCRFVVLKIKMIMNTINKAIEMKKWVFFLLLICSAVFAEGKDIQIKIHLRGVYESKISLMPLSGDNAFKPIAEGNGVKNGDIATIAVPADKLPGEFVLRFDYKQKQEDTPYPAEKQLILSDQDIELWVSPIYSNNPDSTWFQEGEKENSAFLRFMRENNDRKQQVGLLQNFMMNYDDSQSKFYQLGIQEFEKRRTAYNQWLNEQSKKYSNLFISHTFQFQHVSPVAFNGKPEEHTQSLIENYFEGIDMNDTLILHTRNLPEWMNGYVNMYGAMATSEQLRDSLFILAGQRAIENARMGHPEVYGWMVDYFYKGYESFGMEKGTVMLQRYIDDPNCLTSKRQEIIKRFVGMQKMKKGALAPIFEAEMFNGMKLRFDGVSKQKKYELVVFYESDCSHCKELLKELSDWYHVPENKVWFEIITVAMDNDRKIWEQNYEKNKFEWYDVWASGGVNSKAANDYFILSTPVIYIINKDMKIEATPENLKGIEDFLNE